MTEFIVRTFVKDYQNTEDPQVRTRYGVMSSCVGIICNVFLFAVKLLIGIVLNSISVIADAFNNLSDAASAVIGFVGVKIANKPADEDHPFGHGRMEYIAAFIVAFLVIQVGFSFFKSSISKITSPEELSFQVIPFVILILSIAVKFWMGMFNRALGKRIESKVMLATAADSFGDVATTSVTVAAILIYQFLGINVDAYAGIIVSLIVMWAGIGIAKDTLEPLIGEAIDPQIYRSITKAVESYDGIVGTHDLIVHNYGPNRSMASIHAEVPRNVDIGESHEIIDRIEKEVLDKLGIFLVIHMDPIEVEDSRVLDMREKVGSVIETIDEKLSFHDFRMVMGNKQINLIFDLVVPFAYDKEQEYHLVKKISESLKKEDSRFQCVITVEKGFVGSMETEK